MKEIINLTKLFINANLGISLFLYEKDHDSKAFSKKLLIMIVVIVALIPTFAFYVFYMFGIYTGLAMLNQTSVFLSMGYIFATVLIFVFGIMYILSEFYFSKNIEELLSLPIVPRNIIIAKFLSILALEYLLTGLIFLPVLIIYGIGQGMGLLYIFYSLLVFITIPVLPLGILTMIIMLIMGVINIKGRKDVIQICFAFIGVAFIFGFQFFIFSKGEISDQTSIQEMINALLLNNESLLNSIAYVFPTSLLVAWGLNTSTIMSFIWILCLLLITGAVFGLMVLVGEKFYFKGLINSRSGKKGKKLSEKEQERALNKTGNKIISIFLTDFRVLLRTPIYMFNNVSIVIVIPLCLVLGMSIGGNSGEGMPDFGKLYQEFQLISNYIIIAFFLFIGATSGTTSSSFSREGQVSWITRIIPVSPKEQILGRTLTAILIQLLGVLASLICISFYIPLNFLTIIVTIILGMLGSLPMFFFGLFIDMNRPLLNWDNPQKAVKNNMNILITMFVGMAYIFVLLLFTGAMGYFLNPWIGYGLFIIIALGLSFLFYNLIKNRLEEALLKF